MQIIPVKYSKLLLRKNLIVYFFKVLILWLFLTTFLFQVEKAIKSFELRDITRIYLKGVISNPEALFMTANAYLKNKKYDKALEDINLAISIRGDEKFKILRSEILSKIKLNQDDE